MSNDPVIHQPSRDTSAGFTLIELMVVSAILLIVMVIGFPALNNQIHRARMLGYVREVSVHVAQARQESIRRGVPVVVQPRFDTDDLFAYANVDLDGAFDFTPDLTKPRGTVDYQVLVLPSPNAVAVVFQGPADADPRGPDAVEGLTAMTVGPNAMVFLPDGSIRDVGGIRIADRRNNFLEVRAEPAATGRVRVLKFNPDPAWGGDPGFYEQGTDRDTGKSLWVWY